MSLTGTFEPHAAALPSATAKQRKPRPAPFSLRLSPEERARLVGEASGAPLGTYIRAKLLDGPVPAKLRRSGIPVAERRVLGQMVALLGRSRVFSNLNQLAHAANTGSLPFTPETEAELREALADLREIRRLLLNALGLKPEGAA